MKIKTFTCCLKETNKDLFWKQFTGVLIKGLCHALLKILQIKAPVFSLFVASSFMVWSQLHPPLVLLWLLWRDSKYSIIWMGGDLRLYISKVIWVCDVIVPCKSEWLTELELLRLRFSYLGYTKKGQSCVISFWADGHLKHLNKYSKAQYIFQNVPL